MFKQWIFVLRMFSRKLWVRASFFGVLALIASLAAVLFKHFVPDDFADLVGGRAVDTILTTMASSMLIVVTFSLSTMVAAYSSATQSATPRSTTLVLEDSKSFSAISIFLGAFVYSIVSLVALSTGYYGERGRVILLMFTILVLACVVWVIIRWVGQLKDMGRVHDTISRVEKAAMKAMQVRAQFPTFGCREMQEIPQGAKPIPSQVVGYIQNIDIGALQEIAEDADCELYVENDIGAFVHLKSVLVYINGGRCTDEICHKICNSFTINSERTFDNDPRFGVAVLSGIGIKSLSPSLHDPGTVIDVIGSLVKVLSCWERDKKKCEGREVKYKRLYFRALEVRDLFNDAFYHLSKYGIHHLQVVVALKQAMEALAETGDKEFQQAARKHTELIRARAEQELSFDPDLQQLRSSEMIGETQRHTH